LTDITNVFYDVSNWYRALPIFIKTTKHREYITGDYLVSLSHDKPIIQEHIYARP